MNFSFGQVLKVHKKSERKKVDRANTKIGMVYVDIDGHFDDSEGLVGSPQQDGLFSRDGTMDLSG